MRGIDRGLNRPETSGNLRRGRWEVLIRRISRGCSACRVARGFTLVELAICLAIIGVLASIGTSVYSSYDQKSKIKKTVLDIRTISLSVEAYMDDNGAAPASLANVGKGNMLDPWGNPYRYLDIATAPVGQVRKDQFLVPINNDFDLYSMGKDGDSKPPLTAAKSRDDIIRANDGAYVGPASAY